MLMKYNDFKKLSKEDMKQIFGGNPPSEEGCFPPSTPCGTHGKHCSYDSTVEECQCGSVNDPACYKA